jgi:membrane protease YdiL (CAAX protease family)
MRSLPAPTAFLLLAPAPAGVGAAWAQVGAAVIAAGAAALLPAPLVVLLVLAPVLEELVFRAGLQEGLLRRGLYPLAANGAVTLVFALLHGLTRSWPLALAVALPSLLLGRVYQVQRRVAPVVALHAAMNLAWLALPAQLHTLAPLSW